ncbi:MAG: zincin-like metallopeptidase domain-containing protein [Bacteroidota bacterium]
MNSQTKDKKNVYDIVSEHIVSILTAGIIPWRMPWSEGRIPTNLITRKPYRGINVFLLAAQSFRCNLFLSETQLSNVGGLPAENVTPSLVTHWEWVDKQAKEGEPQPEGKYPLLRYHKVYNVEDCVNIDFDKLPGYDRPTKPFETARDIIRNMPDAPRIEYYKTAASYAVQSDVVFMPNSEEYKSREFYYYDLFKLLTYSTAHEKRLNRKITDSLPGDPFSMESLIAEMGAHYLCYHAGMPKVSLADSLTYIHGWIERFKADAHMVVTAATLAQKAVDCILASDSQEGKDISSEKLQQPAEEDERSTGESPEDWEAVFEEE